MNNNTDNHIEEKHSVKNMNITNARTETKTVIKVIKERMRQKLRKQKER